MTEKTQRFPSPVRRGSGINSSYIVRNVMRFFLLIDELTDASPTKGISEIE
jgi:hypothetical protein